MGKFVIALLILVLTCGAAVAQSSHSLKTEPVSVSNVRSIHIDASVADIRFEKSGSGMSWAELVSEQSLVHYTLASAFSSDGGKLTYTLVYDESRTPLIYRERVLTVYLPAKAYDELLLELKVGNVGLRGFGASFDAASLIVDVGNVDFDNNGMIRNKLDLNVRVGRLNATFEQLSFDCAFNVDVGDTQINFLEPVRNADVNILSKIGDVHVPRSWPGTPSKFLIQSTYAAKHGDALHTLQIKTEIGNITITEK